MNISIYSQNKRKFSKSWKQVILLAVFGILQFFIPVVFNGVYAQGLQKKMSLSFNSVPITNALRDLQTASGLQINYDGSIFSGQTKVSLPAQNYTVETALKQLLASSNVGFKTAGNNTVVLFKLPPPVSPGRMIGTIVDGSGDPLVGATVIVQGVGKSVMTDSKGNFNIELKGGTYTIDITYISYESQRVTDIKIVDGKSTSLNIAMKASANTLSQVIVTSSFKKASISGLLARQKNASEISNGISAEQMALTPDRNAGESLKRISGVNTMDNKFVIVRGIGERYNAAALDGTVLPSTEAQRRSFSFDMIPNAIVDNIIVVKSITPDMNTSFGGGLIQINTKDIPTENFMTFGAGMSVNDQSTGKDFLSRKRGKYDYFGFDDGRRDFPSNLKTMSNESPIGEIIDQTLRFKNDNFTVHNYQALPSQNYQFTIGRLLNLDTSGLNKFGLTGALSYRNNQNITKIEKIARGNWNTNTAIAASGNSYEFNTTLGGVLNMGLQIGKHRFSSRNTYTHLYNNSFTRLKGIEADNNFNDMPNRIREADDPTFTTLLQNQLTGQHQFEKIKLEWNVARTGIDRKQKDLGITTQSPEIIGRDTFFLYDYSQLSEARFTPISKHYYRNNETHYSWNVASTIPFDLSFSDKNSLKVGYFGIQRKSQFDWKILPLVVNSTAFDKSLKYLPIGDWLKPENVRSDGFLLLLDGWGNNFYAGKSLNHAGYFMFDNKINDQWRLVWGLRAEYYRYREINNPSNSLKENEYGTFDLPKEKTWQWLPSANLTYSPTNTINVRVAYSSTVVRPEMMDNSQFFSYSAYYDGLVGSGGITSTRVNSIDVKTEWFPGLGEIISVGGYYKYFDKPAELIASPTLDFGFRYTLNNSNWAKVFGLELEVRKNLSFIHDTPILRNFSVYGNLTYQQSKVEGLAMTNNIDSITGKTIMAPMRQKRALYGQTPYLLNAGIQYQGERFGMNLAYNKSGRKTYFVTGLPRDTEYEQPREQLDAQVSYKFLNSRLEIRINGGNILNSVSAFYTNRGSYEKNPDHQDGSLDFSNAERLKPGFTDNYEEGDLYTYRQRFGRTFGTTITYKF
ncbi:TonB-dependent receptor [Sphingobacterium sp. BIGb0165]|uniref:TonB-dependent receptor n=1 Tax=Sphingobacterium sp. BIGb0165 TaxID=2940615 RepID=UPI0021683FB2|nr:TonB-dependent receptor [Sphingobacterium sp. BIGb0165]MCS4224069.1 outer membrane receptor protein involved in Fe transport [Sphingobacterium sp. BIGb0165]